jgi:hypothetical protein
VLYQAPASFAHELSSNLIGQGYAIAGQDLISIPAESALCP